MKLAIIGDFNSSFRPHVATNEAIAHAINKDQLDMESHWIPTDTIDQNF